jgi:phage-related protein
MATFPAITATYGATKNNQPVVRTVQFGDGYQQRLTYGLNQNPKSWDETFLNNRAADNASFDWTPPDEATSYKWICPQWNKTITYNNRATITATFRQVFEP